MKRSPSTRVASTVSVVSLAAAAWLARPTPAHAGRCYRAGVAPRAPISLSLEPSDFGAALGPCTHSSFVLSVRPSLLIDTPNLYGYLSGEAAVSVGVVPAPDWRVSATWTHTQVRYPLNASVTTMQFSMGVSTLAVQRVAIRTRTFQLTPHIRVLLPTGTGEQFGVPLGFEAGVNTVWAAGQRVSLFAGLALPVGMSIIGSRVSATFSPRLYVDAAFFLSNWLEPILGLEVRLSSDANGAFQYIAPRAAVRLQFGGGVYGEVAAMIPLLGWERTDARIGLSLGSGW